MAKALAKRVKEVRLERLLTQKQMANAIGISLSSYIRIEAGPNDRKISDLLKAKVEKFLNSLQVAA